MNSWLVWIVRTAIGLLLTWGGVSIISFMVADYVSDKHMRGMTVAVEALKSAITDLHGNLNTLNASISAANSSVMGLMLEQEKQRSSLALEIATKVVELQGSQKGLVADLDGLKLAMGKLEGRLLAIENAVSSKITFDGGKTFETIKSTDVANTLLSAWKKGGVIADNQEAILFSPFTPVALGR